MSRHHVGSGNIERNYLLSSQSVDVGLGDPQPHGVGGDPSQHIMMSVGQPHTGFLGNHKRRLSKPGRDGIWEILSEVSAYKIARLWLLAGMNMLIIKFTLPEFLKYLKKLARV